MVTTPGRDTRIRWEGDSLKIIRGWPKPAIAEIGAELTRVERGDEPLNSKSFAVSLGPNAWEIIEQDRNFWYRLLYWLNQGWIYVLHCFKKKTNKTSRGDVELARQRMKAIRQRNDSPAGARN